MEDRLSTYPVQQLELPGVGFFLYLLFHLPFLLAFSFPPAPLGGGCGWLLLLLGDLAMLRGDQASQGLHPQQAEGGKDITAALTLTSAHTHTCTHAHMYTFVRTLVAGRLSAGQALISWTPAAHSLRSKCSCVLKEADILVDVCLPTGGGAESLSSKATAAYVDGRR